MAACTYWKPEELSPQQVIGADHPRQLRVVRRDSSRVVVSMPQISGDTLTGWTDDNMQVRILLSDVAGVAVVNVNRGRTTTLLVVSGVLIVLGAWLLIGLHNLANQN